MDIADSVIRNYRIEGTHFITVCYFADVNSRT